ncbi:hypothetical protein G6F61_014410 [Rhizopus arrhizus]|uniref:Uncharacterized protein n=1 Tax=Rhizopus delemar TaxID=936053 RepID=A0A9P7C0L1_9FUNG|nr:hypothetical protein G6F61_014410 [Rhizopus arrhizus]KAG1530594.1 hypothetical protein G6F50_017212 [Rhizopus delemar]
MAYALITHCRPAMSVSSACCRVGRATLTMLMSSEARKVPRARMAADTPGPSHDADPRCRQASHQARRNPAGRTDGRRAGAVPVSGRGGHHRQ